MKEILITSSVLIAALLVLRRVFRKSISRRAQYALWGLVLLRLLVPVNLPALEHNVLTAAEPVTRNMESLYVAPNRVYFRSPTGAPFIATDSPQVTVGPATPDNTLTFSQRDFYNTPVENSTEYQRQIPLSDIFRPVWYGGMALMAVWFLLSNLLFWRKLRSRRAPYPVEDCARRVYLVEEGLPSPCLFGLFRPAIYLTPAAVSSPESLRHVLAHEETHARHLDPLWSLLRAVCLAAYWFDPLVWAAAAASRNDCELACDEGAILRLGEAERIPYGRTLLSLIPVRRGPSNPLLSATTMTAGKKQLKDRVARIAESRRTVGLALFAVIAMAAVVCAATFTGAASPSPQPQEKPDSALPKADGTLTGQELGYFNEEFFNGEGFNIHNQFLTSIYDRPEDIDLFQLFYNGAGLPANTDEAERQAVCQAGYGGEDPGLDLTKLSAADLDAILEENTNLSLSATNRVGLESFTYLPDYDAYYHFHGDTNYMGAVDIVAGTREGELVNLYYETDLHPDGWFCLTLWELRDGGYWFISHRPCQQPSIPTAYPAGEPWMTIPLDDLEPYEPQALEVERRAPEDADRILYQFYVEETGVHDPEAETVTDAKRLVIYQSPEGAIHAAVENQTLDRFFTFPENCSPEYVSQHVSSFHDLFRRSGVAVSYRAQKDGEYYTTFNDYYTVDSGGTPYLLARAYGEDCGLIDLDGDGSWELASAGNHDAQIFFQFFQRDGRLYEANIPALLAEHWTDPVSLYPAYWNKYGRYLYLSGEVPFPGAVLPEDFGGGQATGTAVRQVYFDGESLRLYKDGDRPVTDHVITGLTAPEDVLEAARTMVHDRYEYARMHTGVTGGDGEMLGLPAEYDDWRLEITGGPWFETLGGSSFEIWNINYEFHTTTPERVILAGSSYLTEDAWHCNTYPECTYLYFQLMEDGSRRYLYSAMENDCGPGTEMFRTDMAYTLDEMGVVPLTDLEGEVLADMILMNESSFLNNMAEREDGGTTIDNLRNHLISAYGSALDGLIEINIAFSGGSSGLSHEELYQYFARGFNKMPSDLTEGGAALWERLTEETAPAAGPLLPTLESFSMVPSEVAEAVYRLGKENLTAFLRKPALYDGWRSPNLTFVSRQRFYGLTLDIYSAPVELHPSQPDKVVLAGGMGFTEDGWVNGLMATSPYLVFLAEGDKLTFLESDIPYDYSVDAPGFRAELARVLLENQLVRPSQIDGETLLSMLSVGSLRSLNLLGTYSEEEQEAVLTALDAFHNKGPQEQQLALRDAIQIAAWSQRDLDEHGSALFAKLLERTGIQPYGIVNVSTNHLGSAITNALLHWRQNADSHEADHHSVAYYLLDTQQGGSSCTAYLLVSFAEYDLTENGYEMGSAGSCNAMAVSFSYVNNHYQATEIWQPLGGGLYEPEIRACFPEEAADTVFSRGSERFAAIQEALDSSLKMDVEAWYKLYLSKQAAG